MCQQNLLIKVQLPTAKGNISSVDTNQVLDAIIKKEICIRFDRVISIKICKDVLFKVMGYLAETKTTMSILRWELHSDWKVQAQEL